MSNLQVKIKKLNDKAQLPIYSTDGSAGLDLIATSEKVTLDYVEYGTSLSFEIPDGYVGLLFPRSSITSNTTLILGNAVGVLDSDYRGEISFRFKPLSNNGNRKYKIGDKIGQLVVLPIPKIQLKEVDDLSKTDRGDGSYGSTGR